MAVLRNVEKNIVQTRDRILRVKILIAVDANSDNVLFINNVLRGTWRSTYPAPDDRC